MIIEYINFKSLSINALSAVILHQMLIILHQLIFLLPKHLHLLQQLARKFILNRLHLLSKADRTVRFRVLLQALPTEDMLTLQSGHLLRIPLTQTTLELLPQHHEQFYTPVPYLVAPLLILLASQFVFLNLVFIEIQAEVVDTFSQLIALLINLIKFSATLLELLKQSVA